MKLTGKEILQAAEYVKKHGEYKIYDITKEIPYMEYGYQRFISTHDAEKENIADESQF